jgi:hypothetical protein
VLIYLMDEKGRIRLDNRYYDVEKGAGVYRGPAETARSAPPMEPPSSSFI